MIDMAEVTLIAHLLNQTLSPDATAVRSATDELNRLSLTPHFPFHLLSISTGGENQGQKIAAATFLKNHTRRNVDSSGATPSNVSKEFKDQLMQALLQVEFPILKILVEVFRIVAAADFVRQSLWPELVPNLQSAIQNSHLINGSNSTWNTVNALVVLHALLRPFQYFLNPKVAKEPVPTQLELIAKEILVPLLTVFHQFVGKAVANHDSADIETEKAILTICKCLHFAVKSYMPSTLAPILSSLSRDLLSILSSLSFDCTVAHEDVYLTRWKSGKRSLLIFSSLVTRHRKHSDKLMPDIINCALNIVKFSKNTSRLPFLLERILSLGFDVISNVLETGPGWRLVSPHFTALLESAIFPALVMNEKDMSEWEEDADEYIRKNLPSDIDEISGWREDLFTARKSAVNLLGVISMSKGPPMETSIDSLSAKRKKGQKNKKSNQRRSMGELLVLPFLSKFPIPSVSNVSQKKVLNDYFGVLMAYGGLQDFLRDQESGFVTILIRTRILPLYTIAVSVPHLIASANWVLGELGSCLPEEMSADVYSQLLMALVMPDKQDTSCYPVRVSAAGAITTLLDNDYMPPDFLPLLQVIVSNIGNDENDSSILFQLLSSIMETGEEKVSVHIPHIIPSLAGSVSKWLTSNLEPWPQVVEHGIAALAVMGQTWEDSRPEVSDSESNDFQEKWAADQAAISRAFAALLQQVWLTPLSTQDQQDQNFPTSSCIEDLSTLLRSVMLSVDGNQLIQEFKVPELLSVWAEMIAEWHAWEESEDLSIFDVIKEIVNLDRSFRLKNFLVKEVPPPPAPPVPERSIVEGIATFVSEAINQYPSATYRACSCVHTLLHCPTYSIETEGVKQSLVVVFSRAAFCRFVEVRNTPNSLWKPLLLAISSCYLCYPEIVEGIMEKSVEGGVTMWASALCHVSSSSFEAAGLTTESETKLIVMTLARLIEQLLKQGMSCGDSIQNCFTSLMEVSVQLKELQDEKGDEEEAEEAEDDEDEDSEDDDSEDYDEDSEVEEYEETEEEFLNRYAKAAGALEDGSAIIEEGDVEDQELDMELGQLLEVDEQKVVLSLIEKYHHVLIQGQGLPSQLITSFLNAFPSCGLYFQQY
ncbi:importin beta-like SAD2 homolog [Trifolium pratense]|uniref:Uncharacterized protein n=2 Tax=Trifolium pratense TaxID=57577 RepID=A0ACB0K213_TRIPR|nr:importin beta-like SAD2 homolog [Trifolium pratense]CAJ2650143.1 unnamed protein product [Trifolium pratense]